MFFETVLVQPYEYIFLTITQPVIICSKLTIETLEQGVKYIQS